MKRHNVYASVLAALFLIGCQSNSDSKTFLDDWSAQMVAFEKVSNDLLNTPLPEIDRSLPENELYKLAAEKIREDAAQYEPVLEGLKALSAPDDGLARLRQLSIELLELVQSDLIAIAVQAEQGDAPVYDPEFGQKFADKMHEMIEIAEEYDADTDVLIDQIEGLEMGHEH